MWGQMEHPDRLKQRSLLCAGLFAVGLFAVGLVLPLSPALGADAPQRAQNNTETLALATSSPYYACFDASVALRIGEATSRGKVRAWAVERFESGSCLALPSGTEISHKVSTIVSGRQVERFKLEGTSPWLIRPDWALEGTNGDHRRTRKIFASMLPVTRDLFEYAENHLACLKEVTDLNARVTQHNKEYLETRDDGQDEAVSKSVITFNPDAIAQRGAELNREVQDFRRRCSPYQVLEASTHFLDIMHEKAGLPPTPTPSAA